MKKLFFLLFLSQTILSKEIVYLIRDNVDDHDNNLFNKADLNKRYCIWNNHWEPNMWLLTKQLLEKNHDYELRTPVSNSRAEMLLELRNAKWVIDNTYSLQFSYNLNVVKERWLLDKLAIMIFEPPVVQPYSWERKFHNRVTRVFTWDDSLVSYDPKKYFILRYPFYSGAKNIEVVPFGQKKLCCAINGNKNSTHSQSLYAKRLKDVLEWDAKFSMDFDFYGTGFPDRYCRSYKGMIDGAKKIDCLRNYRFCLSYENMYQAYGWVSERMFNCLEAGCVPVYMGAINIDQFVPKDCYIDRTKFASNQELYNFLKNMSEAEYNFYIQNIKNYLASDRPDEFGYEQFAINIVSGLLS